MVPVGAEDCLYLNVYTPHATPKPKYTVMVFIYGGGFEIGSAYSYTYGPDYFLDEDIVLVTLNYRVGVLGFLSLDDPALPGNLGLKDQRLALRWIHRNIIYFGGDPRRITIFGQSAGAASVHYHMKFTSHEGLFRSAILQSGSSFDCWAFQPPGSQQIYIDFIAARTACNQTNSHEFVDCLRTVPAERFSIILGQLLVNSDPLMRKVTLLTPVIEPPGSEDPFITVDPYTVPTAVPMIAGVTDMEALDINLPPYLYQDPTDTLFAGLDSNYTLFLPVNLQYNDTAEDPVFVSKKLKEFYLGDEHFARKNYLDIVKLYSDGSFINGVYRAARSNRQKTYFYLFSYLGLNSITYSTGSTGRFGAAHADDLYFFFKVNAPADEVPADVELSKKLVKMWTNFAQHFDPNGNHLDVHWAPVSTPHIEYLSIGQTNITMEEKPFLPSRMEFWDELPFRNKPIEFKWPSTPSHSLSISRITEKYLGNRQGQQTSHLYASDSE
ncbi:juvenile hormone esterase-like [Macrosteles quadrilineatus]|uniref:juvenile hormone esterase-like n=1 Tax=Macrosteles quadrilineatus TaxID=74068 RepID=UPI0023E2F9AB|nr:juvenile hormone esterase-like [Macrosteles quadrilineatus]